MLSMATDKPELITVDEAVKRFGLRLPTLRYWIGKRELRKYKRGDGRVFVDAREVEERAARLREIRPD